MSLTIPPLPPFQPQWPDFQVWWQLAKTAIENAQNDLSAIVSGLSDAVDAINAILDPNNLTSDKKPVWMFIYSYLTGEQSDLDAKATTYGITTEKTAYDAAVTALTTYLGTLTTPVAWNDTSGSTTIVDSTFRTKFSDVLTKKQALINKMQASAKTLADTAQSTAATATTNAATAQTTADTVNRNDSISTSWTSPGDILTGTDAGSNATITIANHTRKYTDATSKSVTGGTLTGLAYAAVYYVYYDQTSRAGGSVAYHATTNPNTGLANAAAGRHYCGSVTTPVSGGTATTGGVAPPSGGGDANTGSRLIP